MHNKANKEENRKQWNTRGEALTKFKQELCQISSDMSNSRQQYIDIFDNCNSFETKIMSEIYMKATWVRENIVFNNVSKIPGEKRWIDGEIIAGVLSFELGMAENNVEMIKLKKVHWAGYGKWEVSRSSGLMQESSYQYVWYSLLSECWLIEADNIRPG